MNKKRVGIILCSFVILILFISFVSAGFFSDLWEKITGRLIQPPEDEPGCPTSCPSGYECGYYSVAGCSSVYCGGCPSSSCVNYVCTPPAFTCSDSDAIAPYLDGKNYYLKGTYGSYTDSCVYIRRTSKYTGQIYEYYCNTDSSMGYELYMCPNGCDVAKGACVQLSCVGTTPNLIARQVDASEPAFVNLNDFGCCASSSDCVVNGICYESGKYYQNPGPLSGCATCGEFCLNNVWYDESTNAVWCGNGACQTGETCVTCPGDCGACPVTPTCGDGTRNTGEECDDGNDIDIDGCSNSCILPTCSDGTKNGDETGIDCGGSCSACIASETTVPGAVCEKEECLVLLLIEKTINEDEEIRSLIETYKLDNNEFNFEEVIFEKSEEKIINMNDFGRETKKNSLELRNTIKAKYESDNSLIGVLLIGDIIPTIYRDDALWRDLGVGGFYPSLYPLVALDNNYYDGFDVGYDGFYEYEGMTTGSEVGGGYNASIWAAVLPINNNNFEEEKSNLINYFNRNHQYRLNPSIVGDDFLYASTFGCSNYLMDGRFVNSLWGNKNLTFLCPNTQPELEGFDSKYNVMIHNKGEEFVPSGSSGALLTSGNEELNEINNWITQNYFEDSSIKKIGDEKAYYFSLKIRGRSLPLDQIKETIENNLPSVICGRLECFVFVVDTGFVEKDMESFSGRWSTYIDKQDDFDKLLVDNLEEGVQYTYLNIHGAPTFHQFQIYSSTVKDNNFKSLVYQLESCNTGNLLYSDNLAKTYLYYGGALAVSAYSIPFVIQGTEGYTEADEYLRFLNVESNKPLAEYLFLKNYGNSIYFGDPLLFFPNEEENPIVEFRKIEVETPEECIRGCYLEGDCYSLGYRKRLTYCNQNKIFVRQKKGALSCEANFECLSNVCLDGGCTKANTLKKILYWGNNLFKRTKVD